MMSSHASPAPVQKNIPMKNSMIHMVIVVFFLLILNLSDIAVVVPSTIENSESIASVIRQK